MKMSELKIKQYQKQALYYCDIALDNIGKMAEIYTQDCNAKQIDSVGTVIIPQLVNIYYATKKGTISRDEAVRRQKDLFNSIDAED